MIPNVKNFRVEDFAPDLSKLYNIYLSYKDQMDKHLIQRKNCSKMCHIASKSKEANMQIVWLMIWILTFEYVDDHEKQFRIEQMCSILHSLLVVHNINQKELILQDVFQTVLDYGTFKMIEELYELIKLLNIKGNSTLDNIFFNAIRKHNELIDIQSKFKEKEETKEVDNTDELDCFLRDPFDLSSSLYLPSHFKSPSLENIELKSQLSYDPKSLTEKKKLYISPNVHKEIEYDDRKLRMKRYFSSTNMKSEYFITSKLKFRKRTFKKK